MNDRLEPAAKSTGIERIPDQGDHSPAPIQHQSHPGLHAIAIVEGLKGVLALLAAAGLAMVGPAALHRWFDELIARLHVDPNRGFVGWAQQAINPESVHIASLAITAYGVLRLIEAWGLWRAYAWASWLGLVSAAIYLPFELRALILHRGWIELAVLAVNLLIVWILAHDLLRRRRAAPS